MFLRTASLAWTFAFAAATDPCASVRCSAGMSCSDGICRSAEIHDVETKAAAEGDPEGGGDGAARVGAVDCEWSARTAKPWTREQHEACCLAGQGLQCRTPAEQKAEAEHATLCAAGRSALYSSQRAECCKAFGIECLGKINCFVTAQEKWTPEQRFECCRDHDRGCPAKCTKAACCREKGVCSKEALRAEHARGAAAAVDASRLTTLRLTVEGDTLEVSENPKKLLARVRRTLLKAGKALRSDPTQVVVTVLGVVMPGGTLPPEHRRADWALRVPQAWNAELAAEEQALAFDDASGRVTEADGEENAASAGQGPATLDGVYVVFSVAREADAAEILAAVASGKLEAADGNAQTHAVGSDGVAVVRRGTGVPPDGSAALTYVLAGALWLGGVVAFTVSRVRGQLRFAELSLETEGMSV